MLGLSYPNRSLNIFLAKEELLVGLQVAAGQKQGAFKGGRVLLASRIFRSTPSKPKPPCWWTTPR